jgi:hypothetical protein
MPQGYALLWTAASPLIIFLDFSHRTGHEHPHLRDAIANYTGLLQAMGKSQAEIEAAIETLTKPAPKKEYGRRDAGAPRQGACGHPYPIPNRPSSPAFTSGHSSAMRLKIMVSRIEPLERIW